MSNFRLVSIGFSTGCSNHSPTLSTPIGACPTSERPRGKLERSTRITSDDHSAARIPKDDQSSYTSCHRRESDELDEQVPVMPPYRKGQSDAIKTWMFTGDNDEDEVDLAYIDHGAGEDDDLLEWLTLYDAPRQSTEDSDL